MGPIKCPPAPKAPPTPAEKQAHWNLMKDYLSSLKEIGPHSLLGQEVKPMTATEVAFRAEQAMKSVREKVYRSMFVEQTYIQETAAEVERNAGATGAKLARGLQSAFQVLAGHHINPGGVSIVLQRDAFDRVGRYISPPASAGTSRFRYMDIELLMGEPRGLDDMRSVDLYFSDGLGKPNLEAIAREVFGCIIGGDVGKLPERSRCDRMGAGAYRLTEVFAAPRSAIGNDRDGNCRTDVAKKIDVVAAKAAIAAYARDKKLPRPEMLAAFRDLDDARSPNKAANATLRTNIKAAVRDAVNRDRHSLSAEALGRAADQIGIAEGGRPHRDFIGAAAQGFAEVLDTGDAPTHRKRGHYNRA